ncbi:MAG: hypothetical protein A3C84_03225 [Candidatus Ryanbacteria bacterium RIFCSPHIGHO2_02_FULL_48_12]|uniref:Uncharacterized protein n=1 Tax=Candidatus Ryanbacteria bacterium RIFCSPHIGHO2_01_FULL_48_27 TaxID=1802115 RepID=A0A1G2G7E5_9BACT|nr:MAG: hypothetical protein A2756_05830 [Candidatus Ryanbacteria bacterium RIFCSPHIGHO2_01_FULL_48_27]OGZ50224.1 MAG: hypothetical protein A3C84_03225 [Candidatus Ryanbacteria bacterium RIFCSPHIGHO2_02_FULL_48_12]
MICVFCKKDPLGVIVPVPKLDGNGQDMSCIPCAVEQGLGCAQHQEAHRWFATRKGGHACKSCIQDMVLENIAREREIFVQIISSLSPNETTRITEWLCETTGGRDETRVLDALCMEAMTQGRTLQEVLEEVLTTQSADLIVPLAY